MRRKTAIEFADARFGDGAHSRHRCAMPEGRGPAPLLVIDAGGVAATLVLPHARRPRGRTDADQQALGQIIDALSDLARRALLPRAEGVWWIMQDGPVAATVEPAWIARRLHDFESVRVRLPA